MTDEQRAERIRYHLYESNEGIQEHAERIVALEELVLEIWRSCPVSESDCKMCMCPHYIEGSEEDWCDIPILMEKLGVEVDG